MHWTSLSPLWSSPQVTPPAVLMQVLVSGGGWAAAANLWGSGHTYFGHKIVIKQTDDILLLDILGGRMFWWWWNRRASPQLHAGKITAKTIHMTPHPKRKEGGKKTQTYKNIISKKKNNNNNTQNLRVHHMSATFTAAMDEPRTKNINYYYYYTDTRIHSRHHAAHGTGTRNRFWRFRSCTM